MRVSADWGSCLPLLLPLLPLPAAGAAAPGPELTTGLRPYALLLLQDMGNGFQNKGVNGVAVLIPAGTYRITRMVEIAQSNVVLRGAGVSLPAAALGAVRGDGDGNARSAC